MKKILLFILLGGTFSLDGMAQFVAFHRGNNGTNTIVIPEGETWQLLTLSLQERLPVYANANLNSNSFVTSIETYYGLSNSILSAPSSLNSLAGTPLPGPLYLPIPSTLTNYYLAFKKSRSTASQPLGSASVVIPSSAQGDVDIKLEQSQDKVTWTECQPGTYNSATQKRFFRLRAVER